MRQYVSLNLDQAGRMALVATLALMSRSDFLLFLSLAWVGLLTAIMIVLVIAP
jgi:hypothetical protein